MSDRRPADPYATGRTGAFARSPSERLEPTRPAGRQRRQRFDRGDSGPPRPFVRLLSGTLTLLLVIMLVAGGAAIALQSRLNAAGPLASSKIIVIPKGEGSHDIAARLERDGIVSDRRLFVAGYLFAK